MVTDLLQKTPTILIVDDDKEICSLVQDYLTKPFSSRELLARIKSLLRRAAGPLATQRKSSLHKRTVFKFANWTLDLEKHRLLAPDGVTVMLTRAEYDVLLAFLEHAGRVLTRDQLLELTSDREASPFDRSIDVLIGRLRKKMEDDPKNPHIIQTIRGMGYKFTSSVTKEA